MAITELHARQLVEAHQSGDRRAFDEIARLSYPSLYQHARRRLIDHHAAEDAVQETYVRAYRALPRFEGDFRLQSWLHRILANVCADEGSRRTRDTDLAARVGVLAEEGAADPADLTARAETCATVSRAVSALPEAYRDAVVARYRDDLSYRDVAVATGVSEENARARASRGRAVLQRVLRHSLGWVALALPAARRARRGAATPTDAPTAVSATPVAESVSHAAVTSGSLSSPLSHLSTQLATHVVHAAPTVTRLAEVTAAMGETRTNVVANVVGAVAAVMVPAAAYTALEPSPPPPSVVAADVQEAGLDEVATSLTTALAGPLTSLLDLTTTTVAVTSTTVAEGSSTSVKTTKVSPIVGPSTTLAPVGADGQAVTDGGASVTAPREGRQGALVSNELTVEQRGTRIGISGPVGFATADTDSPPSEGRTGTIRGEIDIERTANDGTRPVEAELYVMIDGTHHELRLVGRLVEDRQSDGGRTYRFVGTYRLAGAEQLGLADSGESAWTLFVAQAPSDGMPSSASSLRISLGDQPRPVEGNTE